MGVTRIPRLDDVGNQNVRAETIPYEWCIAQGQQGDKSIVHKNSKVTTAGTARTLITHGVYVEQTSGARRSFKSSSAQDSVAGTGIRKILVEYIASDGGAATEVVTLNGTTAVDTVADDVKWVNGITVISVGSGGCAAGNIDMYTAAAGGGTVMAQIPTGLLYLMSSVYRVPTGKIAHIYKLATFADDNAVFEACSTKDFSGVGGDGEIELPVIEYPSLSGEGSHPASEAISGYPFSVSAGHRFCVYVRGVAGGTYWCTYFGWLEDA